MALRLFPELGQSFRSVASFMCMLGNINDLYIKTNIQMPEMYSFVAYIQFPKFHMWHCSFDLHEYGVIRPHSSVLVMCGYVPACKQYYTFCYD